MISYLPMVNAWSLAWETLFGDMDKEYPVIETNNIGVGNTASAYSGVTITGPDIEGVETTYVGLSTDMISAFDLDSSYGYDSVSYESVYFGDTMANVDDMYCHHFTNATSPYNDGWTKEFHQKELDKLNSEVQEKEIMSDSRNKYHEKEILKDVEEYVSRTYNGHYTGTKHEYRNVQTIDLMASRDLASDFCQANILKYGSRYGSKDGRNKKDLLKVIHYAMLLLHFDEHYGKPKMTSGNIDHNMP